MFDQFLPNKTIIRFILTYYAYTAFSLVVVGASMFHYYVLRSCVSSHVAPFSFKYFRIPWPHISVGLPILDAYVHICPGYT